MSGETNNEVVETNNDELVNTMAEEIFGAEALDDGNPDSDRDVPVELPAVEKGESGEKPAAGAEGVEKKPEGEQTGAGTESSSFPSTWRKELSAKWAAVDPEVKAEIAKRESDMMKGIADYKEASDFGNQVKVAFKPFEALSAAHGVEPLAFVRNAAGVHARLLTGSKEDRIAVISELAGSLGLGVADFGGGQAAVDPDLQPVVDPHVSHLQNELRQVNMRLSAREQSDRSAKIASIKTEIEKFAADPANKYFDEVSDDIARLIRTGAAHDLPSAYRLATRANDAVWTKIETGRLSAEQAKREADEAEKRKAQEAAAAKARKTASVGVRSTAKTGGAKAKPDGVSIEDTMLEVLNKHYPT